jgi:hypothetical protein
MQVLGIDFTSKPGPRKPITCLRATLTRRRLETLELERWPSFAAFEEALQRPGPWIAGIDFPFGQSRRFIETIGWPTRWRDYVEHAASLGRDGFRAALDAYRATRPPGDKEHRRQTDRAAGSISPQKLYGTPVGLMFFEGAPRLVNAGVTIPGLQQGDPRRIVVEAYPGVLARTLIQRRSYKNDSKHKQTEDQGAARHALLAKLTNGALPSEYGLEVIAPPELAEDPGGDQLDALLCAVQAAWAWTLRRQGFGAPPDADPLEGWIAHPGLTATS